MIWRNTKKKIRETWYPVPAPHNTDVKDAMRWCKEQTSIARFYNHYTNTRWWFESEKDAVLFSMKWCNSQARKQRETRDLNTLLKQARKTTISTGPR